MNTCKLVDHKGAEVAIMKRRRTMEITLLTLCDALNLPTLTRASNCNEILYTVVGSDNPCKNWRNGADLGRFLAARLSTILHKPK